MQEKITPTKETLTTGLNEAKEAVGNFKTKVESPEDIKNIAEKDLEDLKVQVAIFTEKISKIETQLGTLPEAPGEETEMAELKKIEMELATIVQTAQKQMGEYFNADMSEKNVGSDVDGLLTSIQGEALQERRDSMVLPGKEESEKFEDDRFNKIAEKLSDPTKHIFQDYMNNEDEMWYMLRQGDFEYAAKMLDTIKKSAWYKYTEERRGARGFAGWDEDFANWKRMYEKCGKNKEEFKKLLELQDSLHLKEISDMLENLDKGEAPFTDSSLN